MREHRYKHILTQEPLPMATTGSTYITDYIVIKKKKVTKKEYKEAKKIVKRYKKNKKKKK